jgi:hypothetical protein
MFLGRSGGGSKAHIYGMFPGYFLSAYVLGVRRDAPVADKTIMIEPHLGDLAEATGDGGHGIRTGACFVETRRRTVSNSVSSLSPPRLG